MNLIFMKQNVLKLSFLATALAVVAVVPMKAADVVSAAANSPAVTDQVLLDDLVNEALEKNPELKFYEAEIAAAKAALWHGFQQLHSMPQIKGKKETRKIMNFMFWVFGILF